MAPKSIISMTADKIRMYCSLASLQVKDDIFNENIGISDTRRSDVAIVVIDRVIMSASGGMAAIICVSGIAPLKPWLMFGVEKKGMADVSAESIVAGEYVEYENATINADQKMACAGTGSPKKEVVWRVSILNFANRSAEKTGMTNAESSSSLQIHDSFHDKLYKSLSIKLNSIIPGATPKLIASANESSSFPMGEYAFNRRAASPSVKSKKAAMKMAIIAP